MVSGDRPLECVCKGCEGEGKLGTEVVSPGHGPREYKAWVQCESCGFIGYEVTGHDREQVEDTARKVWGRMHPLRV